MRIQFTVSIKLSTLVKTPIIYTVFSTYENMYYTQYFSQELPDHVRYLTPLAQLMGVWPRSHARNCIFIKENLFKLIAFATLNHSRALATYNTLGLLQHITL